MTAAVVTVTPLASFTVAVADCVPPMVVNVTLPTDRSIRAAGPGPVEPSPPPPHAASIPTSSPQRATFSRENQGATRVVLQEPETGCGIIGLAH